MKEIYKYFCLLIVLINCLSKTSQFNLQRETLKDETIYNIDEEIKGTTDYKKAEFEFKSTDINQFFKYESSNIPSSKVSAFRIEFDEFDSSEKYKVYCTSVYSSVTDGDLISNLKEITSESTTCKGGFNDFGFYDGIIEHNESKTKIGIILISTTGRGFTGRVNFRTTERILETYENKPMEKISQWMKKLIQ